MNRDIDMICCKNCANRWDQEFKHDYYPGCGSTNFNICDKDDVPSINTPRYIEKQKIPLLKRGIL